MDRTQATGLVLVFAIIFGYFVFLAPKNETKPEPAKSATTAATAQPSAALAVNAPTDSAAAAFKAESVVLENPDLLLRISTRGGVIEEAVLKHYKTYQGAPLHILTQKDNRMSWVLTGAGTRAEIQAQPFTATKSGNTLELQSPQATLRYRLDSAGYALHVDAGLTKGPLAAASLTWQQNLLNTEKDFTQSRAAATTNYLNVEEDFDKLSETSDKEDVKPEQPIRWISHKTKFFLASIINRQGGFAKADLQSVTVPTDSTVLKTQTTHVEWLPADLAKGSAEMELYLGPNDYKILGDVAPAFQRNVHLGWPVIRWVNRYIVVNVFHFLQKSISNYGIIIVLLVIFIRILLLPLGYRSYLSMAKMRVLKPELDEIKAKHGEDMAAIQQEQMKLYNQVGINPLSGCIPLLLQMPILLAMFNFFPNSIELRQEHLFWAEDLSTWDSIATLPFSLPGYGSHVSLFTILMTISTLAVTYVNASASAATGPMASLQYVMPVVFMFILNSLPAGLSFYYLVSNLVSMAQQFLIKRTVNDAKIRAKLEENKVKNATKKPGKFASRLQEALRQAEEAKKTQEQLKQKPKK